MEGKGCARGRVIGGKVSIVVKGRERKWVKEREM